MHDEIKRNPLKRRVLYFKKIADRLIDDVLKFIFLEDVVEEIEG